MYNVTEARPSVLSACLYPGIGVAGESIRWSAEIHTGVALKCFIWANFPCISLSNSKCSSQCKKEFMLFFLSFGPGYFKTDKLLVKITFSYFSSFSFSTLFSCSSLLPFLPGYTLISKCLWWPVGTLWHFTLCPTGVCSSRRDLCEVGRKRWIPWVWCYYLLENWNDLSHCWEPTLGLGNRI